MRRLVQVESRRPDHPEGTTRPPADDKFEADALQALSSLIMSVIGPVGVRSFPAQGGVTSCRSPMGTWNSETQRTGLSPALDNQRPVRARQVAKLARVTPADGKFQARALSLVAAYWHILSADNRARTTTQVVGERHRLSLSST